MSYYDYRVVPAPREAPRKKGVKGTDARFAHGFAEALNLHARDGWEFQRTETMTAEASRGFLRGKSVETVSVMVFRRWVETTSEEWDATEPRYAERAPAGQQLRPVPETEPPLELGSRDAPALDPAHGRAPHLTAARRTDAPLRPVPGADRG